MSLKKAIEDLKLEHGDQSNRWWLITYNNPPQDDWETIMDKLNPEFWQGQLERGATGTLHIQACVWFPSRIGVSFWKGKAFHSIAIKVGDIPRVLRYCTKEDTRVEGPVKRGVLPRGIKALDNGPREVTDYPKDLQYLKEGRVEEVSAGTQVRYWSNILKISAHYTEGIETPECRGIWVYGPSCSGKTHFARTTWKSSLYNKGLHKWWDGYRGQTTVLLDNINRQHAFLGEKLEVWCDKFSISGEIKGGTVGLMYTTFVVTSYLLPTDIWTDPDEIPSILRRFKFICFYTRRTPTFGTQFGIIPKIPLFGRTGALGQDTSQHADETQPYIKSLLD